MRLGATFACLSLLVSAPAYADDWDLTRPTPAPARARPSAPTAVRPAEPGDIGAARDRYLNALLRDPAQPVAFDRLLALYRARDGNLERLAAELAELAAAKPGSYALCQLVAQLSALHGDLVAARAGYVRAAELAPNASAPLLAHAELERTAGDLARAQALLERALERPLRADERARVLRELGDLALEREEYELAERRFEALTAAVRGGVFEATAFARSLAARGQHARAVAAYDKALARLRGDDRVLPPVLLELARSQLAAGDAEAGLRSLERARSLAAGGSGARAEIDQALLTAYRELGRLPELAERLSAQRTRADHSELLARVYDELGDAERALAAYRAAIARNPRALELRERVIAILSQRGEIDAAVVEYRALQAAAPREPRYVIELGKLLFAAGKRDEAIGVLDQTAARFAREVRIQRALLDVYARWGERERAERALLQLSKLEPGEPAHVVALGEQLLERGDQAGALATWRKITALGGDKAQAHAALGATLLDHDMAARALPEFEAALRIAPEHVDALRGSAEALEKLQRGTDAAERWQKVLALTSDRTQQQQARRRIVRAWAAGGELARRIATLERELGAEGDAKRAAEAGRFLSEAYRALASGRARAAGDARNLEGAERALSRVLELEPGDVESMIALERLRTQRGDLAGAIEILQRLAVADPRNAQNYLGRMSQHSLALYRDADALAYAERAVAQNATDPRAHERLGDLYRAQEDGARAIASYERAVSLDETAFGVQLQLAELYAARGDARAASAALSRVVRACTDDDLVKRAGRSLIALDAGGARAQALEQSLLQLTLANTRRPIFRALLVELYEGLSRPLLQAERERGADADRARAALRAIAQRAVKPLLETLAGGDDAQRRVAIDLLGHLESEHVAAALLAVAERDGDAALRRVALLAAGTTANDALAPRIAALSRVPERRLRDAAAWALARMRGPRALSELRALLSSNLPAVRGQALLGLGRARDAASSAAFEKALRSDPSGFVRGAAALALGMAARDAHGALATALGTERGEAAVAAALALGTLGDRAAAEPLADALFATDPALRRAALWALRRLAEVRPEDRERASNLVPVSPEPEERLSLAAEFDAWLALEPALGVEAALTAFEHELRDAAAAALEGSPVSARVALAFLADSTAWSAQPARSSASPHALDALRRSLAPIVARLCQHPDAVVRAAAVALVAADASAIASGALAAALDDGDEQVQSAALAALSDAGAVDQPVARERLAAIAMRDSRWWMRRRAVEALGRIGGEPAAAAVARVLAEDSYAYVREAAAAALGKLRGASSADALLAALVAALTTDAEPRVRAAAAAALRQIGSPPALRALDASAPARAP